MLHPVLATELLAGEVEVARDRFAGRVVLDQRDGLVECHRPGAEVVRIVLDGTRYDAEPLRVSVVGADGAALPQAVWPGSLFHSIHPVLGRPFVCVRGTYEYHLHTSHLADRWDIYRSRLRLPDLLGHLLTKAGW